MRVLAAIMIAQLLGVSRVAADGGTSGGKSDGIIATFGSVQQAGETTPIQWQASPEVELTADALRLAHAGAAISSEPLPLTPLQHYRVSTTMARGPGGTPRFAISYVDADAKAIEWRPAWQHKHATHANWLPMSPRAQQYVQGFVLPKGASHVRLVLRLDPGDRAMEMARYTSWTLSELRFEAVGKVACCERLGADRLLNGDFEAGESDGLPKWWTQWGRSPDNRVELIELHDEPARNHVLRVRDGTSAQLSSRYLVPVAPGNAFRLSLMVRGQGRVELDVHSHSSDRPMPLRVGNSTREVGSFDVHTSVWQQLSLIWFAEAPNVALANVVVAVSAQNALELDAVELRHFE
jgi:hypothetical protein